MYKKYIYFIKYIINKIMSEIIFLREFLKFSLELIISRLSNPGAPVINISDGNYQLGHLAASSADKQSEIERREKYLLFGN
jgi:hypothetical protein